MPTKASRHGFISTGGPWGTGLLFLGLFGVLYGVGTILRPEHVAPPGLVVIAATVPLTVWGTCWVVAGVWSITRALTPPQQHRNAWPMVGMTSLWQSAFLVHWLFAGLYDKEWTWEWLSWAAWGVITALLISWGRCVNPPVERRHRRTPVAVERRQR